MPAADEMKTEWDTVDGLKWFVRAGGSEHATAPVVLVHGLALSGEYMMPTAVRFAPAHPTYLPDLPGFGKTEKPPHVYDISEMADALARWMQVRGIRHACLIGNSLGCQSIVHLAVRHPELVGWAVLVGPTDPNAKSIFEQGLRGARDLVGEPLAFWPLLAYDYATTPIRTIVTLEHAMHDAYLEDVPRVRVPTLVLRGSRDPIAPQDWAEELVRLLPRGELRVLEGATHVANYTAPDAVVDAVRDFMAKHPGPAAT